MATDREELRKRLVKQVSESILTQVAEPGGPVVIAKLGPMAEQIVDAVFSEIEEVTVSPA